MYGVNVSNDEAYFQHRIGEILSEFAQRFSLPGAKTAGPVNILDGFVGRGYALSTAEELDLLQSVARQEGLILLILKQRRSLMHLRTLEKRQSLRHLT